MIMIGIYIIITAPRYTKKLIGMTILQVSVLLFYISLAYIKDGVAPIITSQDAVYVNPLPHVLMLTAIVVGVATLALGLALIILINKSDQ